MQCILRIVALAAVVVMLGDVRIRGQSAQRPPQATLARTRPLEYVDAAGKVQPVRTAEQWKVRRQAILSAMQEVMGALPDRTKAAPLDVRESGRKEFAAYTRIDLTYAAYLVGAPADRVPAQLYLPRGMAAGERRAAVLALHQTSPQGKLNVAAETKQPHLAYAAELAARGYIVIAPDYPSFGDYQFDFDAEAKAGRFVSGTMKGIFNHMRAVDLLCDRKDVDAKRIGVIGHSLGGHNALFVAAFDDRLAAVVTSCGWTPFAEYERGKLHGWASPRYMPRITTLFHDDARQMPFDFEELISVIAPRPVFSNSPTADDNFDVAGVRRATPIIAATYALLGEKQDFVVREPKSKHDFPDDVRRESYAFLDRVLKHANVSSFVPFIGAHAALRHSPTSTPPIPPDSSCSATRNVSMTQ
jgi:dienelactone hydrolase